MLFARDGSRRSHDVCSTSSGWGRPGGRDSRVRARVDGERPVEDRVRSGQRRHQAAGRILRAGGRERPRSGAPPGGRAERRHLRRVQSTRRTRPAGDGRRRHRPARRQRRRQVRSQGTDRHRQHDGRRPAQRVSLPRAPEDDRAVQDDRGSTEAGRRRRSRRQGLASRLATAQRQGPHVRRQGQPVHQRRRAEQRLSAARSSARREGPGSLPDSREARRHLEVRREQAEPDAGPGHEVRDRPAAVPGHHVARERALHRDEQSRSAQLLLAGQVHGAGQRRPSGRADVSRHRRRELRLAVLLLRLPAEEDRS